MASASSARPGWNGTSWSAFGAGANAGVAALTTMSNGDLAVGGLFTTAGGSPSANFARLTTTCPATVTAYGAGCTGGGGPLTLTADNLPWVGTSFRATANGLVPGSIAAAVIGLQAQSIPLSTLHPAGLPGCDLLTNPIATILMFPMGSSRSYQIGLGTNPALAGMPIRTQVVQAELDPLFSITGLASTNALTARVGVF